MSRASIYMAGCALAVTLAFSTSSSAQLLGGLGDLDAVTEPLAPVVETVAPVVETLLGPEAPLNEIVSVSESNGDYSVSVLQGDDPINVPTDGLPVDVPGLTINLPSDVADIVPELPIPDVPALPDLPDIINDNNNNPGGGGDVINNYPPGNPGTVIIIGDNDPDNPGLPNPGVTVINPGTGISAITRTTVLGTNGRNNGSAANLNGRNKLQMLIAMLQNRGWMRFIAGNGVCLPPYAVASVTDMLNRREERQFNGVVATFANDIATMRQMMANCRKGPRLQAQDINRVIGVGIGQNGGPILYVL